MHPLSFAPPFPPLPPPLPSPTQVTVSHAAKATSVPSREGVPVWACEGRRVEAGARCSAYCILPPVELASSSWAEMLSTLLTFIFGDAGCRSGTRESTGPGVSGDGSSTGAPSPLGPGASAALGEREATAAAAAARRAERGAGAGRGRRGAPGALRGAGRRGRAGGGLEAGAANREPGSEAPLPSPALRAASATCGRVTGWGGGGGLARGLWTPSSQTLRRPEATPRVASGLWAAPPGPLLGARSAGSAEGLEGPALSQGTRCRIPQGLQVKARARDVAAQS